MKDVSAVETSTALVVPKRHLASAANSGVGSRFPEKFPGSARERYTEVVGNDSITEPVAVIDQALDDAQHVRIGSFARK